MSYLCTIIQFIQNSCLEDNEINILLKEIDEISKENANLEQKLDEYDREYVRLLIQNHNLEMITSFHDESAITNLNRISKQMSKDSIELKHLIKKIDFTKILQCYHMEIETKCRKEWEPIQECIAKNLEWHEKMEQRHIVQQYRKAELIYREAENANINQHKSMKKSIIQSSQLINQAKEKRNNLVVNLVKGSQKLRDFDIKMKKLNRYKIYIEGLRQEKEKLIGQLEQINLKRFNPILNLNSSQNFGGTSKKITQISNIIMPQLPSFADILKSFQQTEELTYQTSVEHTTGSCIKSILHNSKQSITSKKIKNVHFRKELEEYREVFQNEKELANDLCIEKLSPPTLMEVSGEQKTKKENLPKEVLENISKIETVDLLTPAIDCLETVEQCQKATDYLSTKNDIGNNPLIQDCIIFKTPFPVQDLLNTKYEENTDNNIKTNCSQKATEAYRSSSSQSDIEDSLNRTKKSFYEEFLMGSPLEASPITPNSNKNQNTCENNYETLLADDTDLIFTNTKSKQEIEKSETSRNFPTKNSSEVEEFLDFDCNKEFAFDSEDNITDNSVNGNMDFM